MHEATYDNDYEFVVTDKISIKNSQKGAMRKRLIFSSVAASLTHMNDYAEMGSVHSFIHVQTKLRESVVVV